MSRWLTALFFVWLCLLTFPVLTESLAASLDGSWGYALNMAHAQGLRFGTDFSFTYGPLAYLSFPDPDLLSAVPVWLYWMGVSVVFWLGAARCLQLVPSRLSGMIVCLALAGMMVFSVTYTERLQAAYLMVIAAILANRETPLLAEFLLAAFVAAFSFLTKTNDGVVALLVYYAVACWEVLTRRGDLLKRWRRWLVMFTAPVLFLLVLFVIAQGTLLNLPAYLLDSFRIAAGYSEAMSIAGPVWQLVVGLLALLVLFLVIPAVADESPAWRAAVLPTWVLGFFLFKHAFVRQDSHAEAFHLKIAAVSALLLVLALTWRDRRLLGWFAVGNIILGITIAQVTAPPRVWNYWVDQAVSPSVMAAKVRDMLLFSRNWERLREGNRYNLAGRVLPPALSAPVGQDTADSVPHDLDFVRANKWNWVSRPVIQSYTAYTPSLDQLNARHLSGANAPAFVLLRWDAIDARHPFLDDAASWRALVNHYDLGVKGSSEYLLSRRRGPRFTEPRLLSHASTRWNENVSVPRVRPGEFVVMRAQIPKTLWGRLRGLLFRVDAIYLHATYASGFTLRYRATRANLVDGALISHLPHELKKVGPYFGEVDSGLADQVEEVRFETEGPRQFGSRVEIDWQVISMKPHEANPAAVLERPRLSWTPVWMPGQPGMTVTNAAATTTADALVIHPQTLDPQIVFQAPGGDLGRFRTLLIRARYSVADLVNIFFSKQIDGRSFDATVPVAEQWLDCFVNTTVNPYWKNEGGSFLRFDPSTNRSRGAVIEVQGVWGSMDSPFSGSQQMAFYPADLKDPVSTTGPTPGSSR